MKSTLSKIFSMAMLCTVVWAYQIQGIVKDENGETVPGATILVTAVGAGTSTDIDGNYKMEIGPGAHKFVVSAMGYAQIETVLTIAANTTLNFKIPTKAFLAEPVVVTSSRVEQRLLDTPITTTVTTGDIIENNSVIEIADALRYVPGITMNKYQISIRNSSGFSQGAGSRVAVLIDGVPLISGDTGEIKWDSLPTKAITQVEVVKGAGSSLYGSGALGGVINIVTKTPTKDELKISTKLTMYDEPHWEEWDWTDKTLMNENIGVLWGFKRGKNSILLTGDVTNSDGYREGDDFTRGKALLKIHHNLPANKGLTFYLNTAYEDRASYLQWRSIMEALRTEDGRIDDRVWSTKLNAAAVYKSGIPKRNMFFTAKIYENFYNWHTKIFNSNTRLYDMTGSVSTNTGVESQVMFARHDNIITGGAELRMSNTNSEDDMFGDHWGAGGALFVNEEYNGFHPIVLNGGIRVDAFHADGADKDAFVGFSPKLSSVYHLTENSAVRLNVSSGFRMPSMAELFTNTTTSGIIKVEPNPSLKSEQGFTTEIGGNWVRGPFLFDGAVFYNYYLDMIEPTSIVGTLVKFTNLQDVRIYGTEFSTKFMMFEKLLVSASYLYTDSKGVIPNRAHDGSDSTYTLPYRPDHQITLQGEYEIVKNLSVGASYQYKSERGFALFPAETKTPVKLLDLYTKYSFGKFDIDFRVNNVTNYNYTEVERNLSPIRHYNLNLEYAIF